MALQKIKFQTNIPVEMALKFAEGKLCDSQFGDPQYMFTTVDDQVFFVAEKVAQKIHGLRLKPQEPLEIIKAEKDYGNGRKGIEWLVNRVGFTPGEQPDGTFAVPAASGTAVPPAAPVSAANKSQQPRSNGNGSSNGHTNGNGHAAPPALPLEAPQPLTQWAVSLLGQTKQVIDVYAMACEYASKAHGNTVRTDDVRVIMTTAFINLSKQGGANVA
jgi:hypothetical protein